LPASVNAMLTPPKPQSLRTQVAIIGGGPAGLLLSHLLANAGITSVIIERQTAAHVMERIRAGVLEQGSVDILTNAGLADRLHAQGQRHAGFALAHNGKTCRIALNTLANSHVTIYGQTEVTADLMAAHIARNTTMFHAARNVSLHNLTTNQPHVRFEHDGDTWQIEADFIAGCDGFRGPSRQAIPMAERVEHQRDYPFGWLGILADVPPCSHELIYASSARGFALASMRSPTRSRYYIQFRADEDIAQWSDDRIWDELATRLGPEVATTITPGPALEKSIAPLRSFVCETMRYGRLFLAGDAAHIVPPTGAKGLNLALGDVQYLATALNAYINANNAAGIENYAKTALARVWKSERFSWSLTNLLHDLGDADSFGKNMRAAELDYIFNSQAAQTTIAENYVGLPFDDVLA
jgi:p-hydroxybenzoate 3-monooxygenase